MNVGPSIHLCLVKVTDLFFSLAMFVIISTERSSVCRKNEVSLPFPAAKASLIVSFHWTDCYVAIISLMLKGYETLQLCQGRGSQQGFMLVQAHFLHHTILKSSSQFCLDYFLRWINPHFNNSEVWEVCVYDYIPITCSVTEQHIQQFGQFVLGLVMKYYH